MRDDVIPVKFYVGVFKNGSLNTRIVPVIGWQIVDPKNVKPVWPNSSGEMISTDEYEEENNLHLHMIKTVDYFDWLYAHEPKTQR